MQVLLVVYQLPPQAIHFACVAGRQLSGGWDCHPIFFLTHFSNIIKINRTNLFCDPLVCCVDCGWGRRLLSAWYQALGIVDTLDFEFTRNRHRYIKSRYNRGIRRPNIYRSLGCIILILLWVEIPFTLVIFLISGLFVCMRWLFMGADIVVVTFSLGTMLRLYPTKLPLSYKNA